MLVKLGLLSWAWEERSHTSWFHWEVSEACQSKGDFLLDPGRSLYSVKAQVVKLFLFELMQSNSFFSTSISCYLFHGLLDFHVKYVLWHQFFRCYLIVCLVCVCRFVTKELIWIEEARASTTCIGPEVGPKNTCFLLFIKAYLEKDSVWLVCLSLGLL